MVGKLWYCLERHRSRSVFVYPDLRNLWYLGWDPHYYRVFATLLDPNYVGILLVLTIFVWIYIWVNNKKLRIWFVPLFMIAGAALS